MSSFTWLDHTDEDAQKVREALAAFDEQGMVDPLGFGVVRDAFSDMLFPGLSTVQTRPRYFLFVPWIYQRLDRDRISPAQGASVAKELELDLIESLLRGSGDDTEGIIGSRAGRGTKQLPSFVYWGGLGRFGIRRFEGTRRDYVASLALRRQRTAQVDDESSEAPFSAWHPDLPEEPEDLFEGCGLALTADEAGFLSDRILATVSGSYTAALVRDATIDQDGDAPWEHPVAAGTTGLLRSQLHHARLFSLVTWGAGLLYNDELSRLLVTDGADPLPVDYVAQVAHWGDLMDEATSDLANWDRDEMWSIVTDQNPRAVSARTFVDWWLSTALAQGGDAGTDREVVQRLREREALIKTSRAKLSNRRARENSRTAQGGDPFTYRWREARDLVHDVLEGMASSC